MNKETNESCAVDACYALLWIHTHHQTNEPLQIDVTEWSGRVDVLEQLTDDAKIDELDLTGLKCENWINVRVEYSWEETDYSLRLFSHNVGISPSYFARAGVPACSIWGKTEIEELAWAYVTAMARDGDTWHPITDTRAAELLTPDEHRGLMVRLPLGDYPRYRAWWDMIAAQLKDAAGAFEVGGLAWNRRRHEQANK